MSPFESALRRKFKTPKAAMDALGLDYSLLSQDVKTMPQTRRLARDQSPVDADFCLRIVTTMLEKLGDQDPDEAARFRAGLAELASAGEEDTDPEQQGENLEPRGARDSAARGWRAAARGTAPGPADRRRPGFFRRFPAAAKITNWG